MVLIIIVGVLSHIHVFSATVDIFAAIYRAWEEGFSPAYLDRWSKQFNLSHIAQPKIRLDCNTPSVENLSNASLTTQCQSFTVSTKHCHPRYCT